MRCFSCLVFGGAVPRGAQRPLRAARHLRHNFWCTIAGRLGRLRGLVYSRVTLHGGPALLRGAVAGAWVAFWRASLLGLQPKFKCRRNVWMAGRVMIYFAAPADRYWRRPPCSTEQQ